MVVSMEGGRKAGREGRTVNGIIRNMQNKS